MFRGRTKNQLADHRETYHRSISLLTIPAHRNKIKTILVVSKFSLDIPGISFGSSMMGENKKTTNGPSICEQELVDSWTEQTRSKKPTKVIKPGIYFLPLG